MPVDEIDSQIFALRASELSLKILQQFVRLRADVTSEPGEVGHVQLDVHQNEDLGASSKNAIVNLSVNGGDKVYKSKTHFEEASCSMTSTTRLLGVDSTST